MSRPGAAASRRRSSTVLDPAPELVVKLVDGSGGYGMLVGPTTTHVQIETFAPRVAEPHPSIARPFSPRRVPA